MSKDFYSQWISMTLRPRLEGYFTGAIEEQRERFKDIDTFAERVKEDRTSLEQKAGELAEIRATLLVNFGPNGKRRHLCALDADAPNDSVRKIVYDVLVTLVTKLEAK